MEITKGNLRQISDGHHNAYANFVLEQVNDHCLRMAVFEGDYRWHYHQHTDELFIVLEGKLQIEIEHEETIYLGPGDFLKIPAGTVHKTSALGRVVNLCVEKNGEDTVFI